MEDAATAGLSHEAFRVFIGMITVADDHGILRATDRYLERVAFLEVESERPIAHIRSELARKLVTFYEASDERYAHLRGWQRHQRVDNAAEPRLPLPPGFVSRRRERHDGKRARYWWAIELVTVARTQVGGPVTVAGTTPAEAAEIAAAGSPITDRGSPITEQRSPRAGAGAPETPLPVEGTETAEERRRIELEDAAVKTAKAATKKSTPATLSAPWTRDSDLQAASAHAHDQDDAEAIADILAELRQGVRCYPTAKLDDALDGSRRLLAVLLASPEVQREKPGMSLVRTIVNRLIEERAKYPSAPDDEILARLGRFAGYEINNFAADVRRGIVRGVMRKAANA